VGSKLVSPKILDGNGVKAMPILDHMKIRKIQGTKKGGGTSETSPVTNNDRRLYISPQTNLVNTASAIANKIKELTPDYKLGFGSFSDKPTAPFASEISYYEKNNKPVPYAFRHQVSILSTFYEILLH
jgi:hypothetical protein